MKKVSLICTVLNEQETINQLLTAIAQQSLQPDEVLIVDGGSQDQTLSLISEFAKSHPKLNLNLMKKPGANISQGRNFAITQAKNELIAITDAGCAPQTNWLEELLKAYQQTKKPVIAGYYYGLAKTKFQKAVVPYVLVMPERVDPNNFLPASRSMLIEKKVWKKLDGFDEKLKVSEDFAFAKKLNKNQVPIDFAQAARVGWLPRKNIAEFIKMIYNFAFYDAKAGNFRPKVVLIFARYLFNLLILIWLWPDFIKMGVFLAAGLIAYSWWAISKNKKYAADGWIWLPVLQVSSDLAVMIGTIAGAVSKNSD